MSYKFRVQRADGSWRTRWLEKLPLSCGCDGTIEEWLAEGETSEILQYRYIPQTREIGTVTFELVQYHSVYGGPEEGGWYRTATEYLRTFTVRKDYAERAKALLLKYCAAQNVGLTTVDSRHGLRTVKPFDIPVPQSTHYC